jgi:hypothetical protein
MEMRKFDDHLAETFNNVLEEFLNASDNEMEPYVREKIKKFLNNGENRNTREQIFDFCDSLSKLPVMKISKNACVGDISTFMQSVFDVTKYYTK